MSENNRLPIERLNQPVHFPAEEKSGRAKERFSDDEMSVRLKEFAERFQNLYRGIAPASIARRLKTTDAVVKNYLEAKRFPTVDMLLQIQLDTRVNLHWLLTGEGSRSIDFGNVFSEDEEREIQYLAVQNRQSFHEQVRVLTVAAVEFLKRL